MKHSATPRGEKRAGFLGAVSVGDFRTVWRGLDVASADAGGGAGKSARAELINILCVLAPSLETERRVRGSVHARSFFVRCRDDVTTRLIVSGVAR